MGGGRRCFCRRHAKGNADGLLLLTSVAKADELRKLGADAGSAEIESVQHYEIGMTVGTPTA
jgi:hypothetical protein